MSTAYHIRSTGTAKQTHVPARMSLLQSRAFRQSRTEAALPEEHERTHSVVPSPSIFLALGAGQSPIQHSFSRIAVQPPGSPMIQAKLTIGQPGDKYEQEADRVADEVMRMPLARVGNAMCQRSGLGTLPQGCSACEDDVRRQLVRQDENGEEILQAQQSLGKAPEVAPNVRMQVKKLRNSYKALPKTVSSYFAGRFGHDLSNVRIHIDQRAAEVAQMVNARAFTVGQDIVFGAGQYAPDTYAGGKLMAHELTHVIQQRENKNGEVKGRVQRSEMDTLSQCPAYYRYNASIPISRYNCAGLAHRTYRWMGRADAFPYLSSSVVSRIGASDTCNPGQVKYWVWEYGMHFEAGGERIAGLGRRRRLEYLPGIIARYRPLRGSQVRPDWHMVAGITDSESNDPTDVYSKNGRRPVYGPGTGPSFRPPSRERATVSEIYETPMYIVDVHGRDIPVDKVRSNMQESCYCAPCPQRPF